MAYIPAMGPVVRIDGYGHGFCFCFFLFIFGKRRWETGYGEIHYSSKYIFLKVFSVWNRQKVCFRESIAFKSVM